MKTAKIVSIRRHRYEGNVYNLELESSSGKDDLFWVCNGIVVHNCFPKDLNALTHVAKEAGVNPTVMEAVWRKNLEVVPEEHRDWEKMPGRAVSVKKSDT